MAATAAPTVEDEIVAALADGPLALQDIYARVSGTENYVRQQLSVLTRAGAVRRVGRGVYALGDGPGRYERTAEEAATGARVQTPAVLFTVNGSVGWDMNAGRWVAIGPPTDLPLNLTAALAAIGPASSA